MTRYRNLLPALGAVFLAGAAGCVTDEGDRSLGPAVIELQLPASMGPLRRPAVEFDHTQHTKALADQDCTVCHPTDADGELVPLFQRMTEGGDRDQLMELYHDRCVGCHKERDDAGPVTCGECHVRRDGAAVTTRVLLSWDYSLHRRHVAALADQDKEDQSCQLCHHVYDEETKKLEYRKGKEEACSDCHGAVDDGDNPSLQHAAHDACVNCHLKRHKQGADVATGPLECEGCHDATRQKAYRRIDDPPRLERAEPGRQPDAVWLAVDGATSHLVPFDHKTHEGTAPFCTTCHHQTLKACDECHTLTGSEDGHGVTLEQAYHDLDSDHSCVGCHRQKTLEPACVGCHEPRAQVSETACVRCHSGPAAEGVDAENLPVTFPEPTELEPLPEVSPRDFPDQITLDSLADKYQPTELEHLKIVTSLYQKVGDNKLAAQFHATTRTLCAGCHHQSPVGQRPPACKSCHAPVGDPRDDKPGLRAAYHRQCIGCHQRMAIEKVGCVDCHALAADKESTR